MPLRNPRATSSSDRTVNVIPLLVAPPTVTVTRSLVAPWGTVTMSRIGNALSTVAGTPPKRTSFSAGTFVKPTPLMTTIDPTTPLLGARLAMPSGGDGIVLKAASYGEERPFPCLSLRPARRVSE